MKFVIIEDERLNASRLKKIVEQLDDAFQVIDIIDTISGAIEWFQQNPHPEVALMDIRLGDGLSFEIFDQVKVGSAVIFTTAYDEYAIQAFKVNGVDYLLKPVEREELEAAIQKIERTRQREVPVNDGLAELIDYVRKKETGYRQRFLFPFRDGYKTVNVSDIKLVYSESKITHLVLTGGAIQLANQTLEELEQQLDPAVFFRANRQFIININSIESIHNHFNGKLKVVIRNNAQHEVLISKEKSSSFKQWLDR